MYYFIWLALITRKTFCLISKTKNYKYLYIIHIKLPNINLMMFYCSIDMIKQVLQCFTFYSWCPALTKIVSNVL